TVCILFQFIADPIEPCPSEALSRKLPFFWVFVRVAAKPDEIKGLLEVGFEYVCQKDGLAFLRKRK
ncbi:MAG: hypothetical protein O2U62_01625, partial [Candidatus Bathyarchaeota archaeon]|nr:hypothetical protein [Candidatus Bathyarchaeota archaeon]